jgi:hypothetical protein
MPTPTRRERVISLRLSEEEYGALKTQCRSHGARNMSDFARLALDHMMHEPDRIELRAKVEKLVERFNALEALLSVTAGRVPQGDNAHGQFCKTPR